MSSGEGRKSEHFGLDANCKNEDRCVYKHFFSINFFQEKDPQSPRVDTS